MQNCHVKPAKLKDILGGLTGLTIEAAKVIVLGLVAHLVLQCFVRRTTRFRHARETTMKSGHDCEKLAGVKRVP